MKKHAVLLLGACFAFSAQAQIMEVDTSGAEADDEGSGRYDTGDRRLYFAPMFSYTFADDDRATEDLIGGQISVGKKMTSGLNLELTGFYTQGDWKGTGSTDPVEFSGVGAAAQIFPSATFYNLYVLIGLQHGNMENHPTNVAAGPGGAKAPMRYTTTVFDPGVGWLMPIFGEASDIHLRVEARYRMDAHTRKEAGLGGQKHFYEGVLNVGLHVPLGKMPVAATGEEVEVVEAAEAADADSDGVADDTDQCPETPAGTTVNEQGCEGDTDADGVVDRIDSCPDTAAGTAVDEKGCAAAAPEPTPPPAAESGCRAPAPGQPVNLEGCATGESVVLKGVTFEVNSSRLTANAKVILNQVADSLSANPDMKVEIGGHSDSQGSDSFNQKLSERRAQAVMDYLVARGIDSARLGVKGYGESQPIDSNETAEGREQNRRVELKVVESGEQ